MKGFSLFFALTFLLLITMISCLDVQKKSIIFDLKTPKVFYCPQHKPSGMEKMIVRAVPLEKLCEYGGEFHSKIAKEKGSDCYDDIDESPYACAEKERIMLKLNPPKDSEATTMIPTPDAPDYIIDKKKEHMEKKKSKSKKN